LGMALPCFKAAPCLWRSESQLQKEIDKIEKEPGAENYTIDDILEKLEQRESITLLIFDCYEIEM